MVSVVTFSTIPGTKTETFHVQIGIKFRHHVLKKRLVSRFFLPVLSVTTTFIQTTKAH